MLIPEKCALSCLPILAQKALIRYASLRSAYHMSFQLPLYTHIPYLFKDPVKIEPKIHALLGIIPTMQLSY